MLRIQNLNFKNIILIKLIVLLTFTNVLAQENEKDIEVADSLFNQQKYTQSFEIYNRILKTDNLTSPAMLLKMAYIKEGLGDYSNALYYLNLYYLQTHNKRALRKMEDLAKKYNLQGYKYTDMEFFMNIFYRYYSAIVYSLSGLVLILIGYIVYKKLQLKTNPGFSLFYLLIVVAILFYVVNFGKRYQKGIIISQDTYLMAGPSSGSKLIAIADLGHRVHVLGKEDVWVKVEWEGSTAYIKENNILQIIED
jgi:tetratricopeptide (TPR) repeat protein